jgi:metal-dependent amidase/aminoacylase/carboxypeptidase family protein
MWGHDGHTTILAALARLLGRRKPAKGRVILMFQPAEETGGGALGVVNDPRYAEILPDFAFSLHNLPGVPLGEVRLKAGTVDCASRGDSHQVDRQDCSFLYAGNGVVAYAGDQPIDAGITKAWTSDIRG